MIRFSWRIAWKKQDMLELRTTRKNQYMRIRKELGNHQVEILVVQRLSLNNMVLVQFQTSRMSKTVRCQILETQIEISMETRTGDLLPTQGRKVQVLNKEEDGL